MRKQQAGYPPAVIKVESVISLFRLAKIVFASGLFWRVKYFAFDIYPIQ